MLATSSAGVGADSLPVPGGFLSPSEVVGHRTDCCRNPCDSSCCSGIGHHGLRADPQG